jgi:hypothetical protein
MAFRQIAAHCAARCTTQTGANRCAVLAAEAVANHRTTRRADAATNGRFGPATLASRHCAARCAGHTGTNRCTAAAAHFLADHITQRATQPPTKSSGAVTGSHRTLSKQKSQNQSGQCEAHDENLKNRDDKKGSRLDAVDA